MLQKFSQLRIFLAELLLTPLQDGAVHEGGVGLLDDEVEVLKPVKVLLQRTVDASEARLLIVGQVGHQIGLLQRE